MELVVTENITLDGVIDASEGWFDPAGEEDMGYSDVVEVLRRQMEAQDALLVGRVTFESFRGYWPEQVDDETGIREHLDSVAKYVVSSTLEEPGWENTTILRGPLEDDVRALKQESGNEIGVTGSISVVHSLIAAGLVDEYRLFVYPVVLGRGARLFAGATGAPKLRLLEASGFRSGIVLLRYRPE
jgi:dihydrofolate reductase